MVTFLIFYLVNIFVWWVCVAIVNDLVLISPEFAKIPTSITFLSFIGILCIFGFLLLAMITVAYNGKSYSYPSVTELFNRKK